jgi:APA family basic amino acid/polyamine antiporter
LGFLAYENRHGIPAVAIAFQTGITLILVITSTFDAILVFASFTLALNTLLTVAGVWVLRRRQPDLQRSFVVPGYPWPMLIYIGITLWTLIFVLYERPVEALVGGALIVAGWLFYMVTRDRVIAEKQPLE